MRYSTGLLALLLLASGLSLRGDTDRQQRLGAQLICSCGCTQGALVCNHVGCPVVTQMRAEIAQRSLSTDSDALILQSFVQEYGSQVLANPTKEGFNLLAWIMPWVAVGCGIVLLTVVVRRWSNKPQAIAANPALPPDPVQARIRREIEIEMERNRR